jgi:hypothetical protein
MLKTEAPGCYFRLEVFAGELALLHDDSTVSEQPSLYVQFLDYVPLVLESHMQSNAGASTTAWQFSCKSCSLLANPAAFAVQLSNGVISVMLVSNLTEKQAQMHGSCSIATAALVPTPAKHVLHSTGLQLTQHWGLFCQQVSLFDLHGSAVGAVTITVSLACLGRAAAAHPEHVILQPDDDKSSSSNVIRGHCILLGEYGAADDAVQQQPALHFNEQTATAGGIHCSTQTAELYDKATAVQDTSNIAQSQQQHASVNACHHAVLQGVSDELQEPANGIDQRLSQIAAPQTVAAAQRLHTNSVVASKAAAPNTEVDGMPGNNRLDIPVIHVKDWCASSGMQSSAVDHARTLYYRANQNASTNSSVGEFIGLPKAIKQSAETAKHRLSQQYHSPHEKHSETRKGSHLAAILHQHRGKRADSKHATRPQQRAVQPSTVRSSSTKQTERGHPKKRYENPHPALSDGTVKVSSNALIRRVLFDMIQQTYSSTVSCSAKPHDDEINMDSNKHESVVTTAALSDVDKHQLLQYIRAYSQQPQLATAPVSQHTEELLSTVHNADVDAIVAAAISNNDEQVIPLHHARNEQHDRDVRADVVAGLEDTCTQHLTVEAREGANSPQANSMTSAAARAYAGSAAATATTADHLERHGDTLQLEAAAVIIIPASSSTDHLNAVPQFQPTRTKSTADDRACDASVALVEHKRDVVGTVPSKDDHVDLQMEEYVSDFES